MSAGFISVVANSLVGKQVEIYQGSQHDIIKYADFELFRKTVIYGKLLEATGDCLVVECKKGNSTAIVYVNSWTVNAIMEVSSLSIFDVYVPDERKVAK